MFIASFMPWLSAWIITVNGFEGDGKLTAVFSIAAGGLLGLAMKQRNEHQSNDGATIGSIIATFLTFGIYVYHLVNLYADPGDKDAMIQIQASPEIGLILGPTAGVGALFGLLMLKKTWKQAQLPSTPSGF